jgi:TonB-like protein
MIGGSLLGPIVGLLLVCPTGPVEGAAQIPAPSPNPPGKVPAGVILVKGAWSSASDSVTPLPEGGTVTGREYSSAYFHLSYPISAGWIQQYEGPPPSDTGYYVLAQIQPPDTQRSASRGTVLIAAQDMFFASAAAKSALALVNYTGSHLRADYVVERQPSEVKIAGHSFVRLDYVSPVARLHWATLVTQIRCHTVQFTFTSTDTGLIEHLVAGMNDMKLPPEAGVSSGAGGDDAPLCIKDYASGGNVLTRVDPIFADRHYNPIPARVVIDRNGKVKHIHFISSFPEQAKTVTEALQQWRFRPYMVNGRAVEVETGILFGTASDKTLMSLSGGHAGR